MFFPGNFLKTLILVALLATLPAGCKHWPEGKTFAKPTIERDSGGGGGSSGY